MQCVSVAGKFVVSTRKQRRCDSPGEVSLEELDLTYFISGCKRRCDLSLAPFLGVPYRHFGEHVSSWKEVYESIFFPLSNKNQAEVAQIDCMNKRISSSKVAKNHRPRLYIRRNDSKKARTFNDARNESMVEVDYTRKDLRFTCRGKSCYCKDCGGIQYYERFQKKINLFPLPDQVERLQRFLLAAKYVQYLVSDHVQNGIVGISTVREGEQES